MKRTTMKIKQRRRQNTLPRVTSTIKESKEKLDKIESPKIYPLDTLIPQQDKKSSTTLFDSAIVLSFAGGFTSLGIAIGLEMIR